MKYSVVIRTKNSETTIERCLRSVFNQTLAPDEVLILDSGSTDRTIEIARGFGCKLFEYPKDRPFEYSFSLNLIVKETRNEWVMILSSHSVILYENAFEKGLELLQTNERICCISYLPAVNERHKVEVNSDEANFKVLDYYSSRGLPANNSCNFIYKPLWETRGFLETIPRCEDQEWALYWMKKEDYRSVQIENFRFSYENPYHSMDKVVMDAIFIGRNFYPPILSFSNIFKKFSWAVIYFIRGDWKNASNRFHLALSLFRNKFRKREIEGVNSSNYSS